ncbi:MFS transporter [Clostridium vincentii]|uniref:Bicyclomycin/multidrug efflux system n=1 Tax=Clostridium vincentii TaxID=52704 RepID=A0A2T0BHJ0_9CLOT|nr:MFS transporter [Clostridium vincentii]PRR83360.1 bicyclomycin/multidrug efflux system [Clostridium vincentii]
MGSKNGSKLWSKYYIITILLSIGINMVSHLLLSTIVIHAKAITGSDIYAGFMTTVFTLSALFVRTFIGKVLDKVGRKKVLIVGMIITAIAALMYGITDNIYIIIISRIIHGIGFGITSTAIATIVTDIIPEDRLLEGIGYAGIAATVASALGPTMALSIIGSDYSNFKSLFFITFIIAAITTVSAFPVKYKFQRSGHKIIINKEDEEKEVKFFSLGLKFFAPLAIIFILAIAQTTVICFSNSYI